MKRWLTLRNANRAAWAVILLIVAGFAVTGAYLLFERVTAGRGVDERAAEGPDAEEVLPSLAPPGSFTGTLEQVQGSAVVVRLADGSVQRALLREGASISTIAVSRGRQNLAAGETVTIGQLVEQPDGAVSVRSVVIVALPEEVIAERCRQVGTVTAAESGRLVFAPRCGEQRVPIARDVRISRVTPAPVDTLQAGKRVTVFGERLVDGTLAATVVQVLEQR